MLNKRKRLRSMEVEEVMKTGKSARSMHLQVKFVATGAPLRSAAVVPKAVARKAVARNNLRRTLYRALAAANMANCKGNAVFFVRTIPKTGPKDRPGAVFSEELIQLLSKLS